MISTQVPLTTLPPTFPPGQRFPWLLAGGLVLALGATFVLQPASLTAQSAHVSAHHLEVVPLVSGLVVAVAVAAGDRVEEGRVVARLDDTGSRLRVQQAEARLARSRGNQAVEAGEELALAREDLAHHLVLAPRAGTVVDCRVEPGDFAITGSAVMTVRSTQAPWIDADISERDARAVHLGARAHVALLAYPGRSWEGRVSRLGLMAERKVSPARAVMPVQITLEGLPPEVLPDMSATVIIDR
jgi:multidrug efflux system membrane fusion protein